MAEEKKGFFQKLKKNLSDTVLETKIQFAFDKQNPAFTLSSSSEILEGEVEHGILEGTTLTLLGVKDYPVGTIVMDGKDKPYQVLSCRHEKDDQISIVLKEDDKDTCYVRPATKLNLTEEVIEVKVVRCRKRYFLLNPKK